MKTWQHHENTQKMNVLSEGNSTKGSTQMFSHSRGAKANMETEEEPRKAEAGYLHATVVLCAAAAFLSPL